MAALALQHVGVLTINVSGYEPVVLEGTWQLLSEGRVDILILLLGLESLSWYKRIAEIGYRFFYYHPKQGVLYEVTAFDQSNVLDPRPCPARHIIVVRAAAIDDGIISGLQIQQLTGLGR